jgi:hypothetical protein
LKTVQFTFVGDQSDLVANTFYSWAVDGGLEQALIDELTRLTPENIEVEGIFDFNNEELTIAINSKMISD